MGEMDEFVDPGDPDTQQVVDVLKTYAQAPRADVKDVHLARIETEAGPLRIAARTGDRSAEHLNPPPRWRFRMSLKRLAVAPAAAAAALLGTAGLAAAGVNLPDAARAPFDAVGVQLPNQSRASDVHAVIDTTQPADRGCEFGHSVAQAASQGRSHSATDACDHQQGSGGEEGAAHGHGAAHQVAHPHGQNAPEGDSDSTPQGNTGSQPSGVPPAPPDGQAFGQQTATNAQQNASNDGQAFGQSTSQNAQNLSPATPPAGTGAQGATGQSHAAAGSSNAADTPAGSAPGSAHVP